MSIELKIKAKHLALEIGVIRFEEAKVQKRIEKIRKMEEQAHKERNNQKATIFYRYRLDAEREHTSLVRHRKEKVSTEVRATNLARAYLKGVPYKTVENKRKMEPDVNGVVNHNEYVFWKHVVPRVAMMCKKYNSDFKVRHKATDEEMFNLVSDWINQ